MAPRLSFQLSEVSLWERYEEIEARTRLPPDMPEAVGSGVYLYSDAKRVQLEDILYNLKRVQNERDLLIQQAFDGNPLCMSVQSECRDGRERNVSGQVSCKGTRETKASCR